ncbi:MAG: SRPBCC family protein [Acidobacteria bacterium]|nr:SRPBCC family protein [Acidobacteriota bacterium]
MPVFVKSLLVNAPVEDVFRFHERQDALRLLSPPFPPVRIVSRVGTAIEAGTRVELRVGWIRWVAQHTAYEKNRLFVDEQIDGPFTKWIHRHEFEAVGGKTLLTDRIEYSLPGGPLVNVLFGWIVLIGLRNMFAYRHRVTSQAISGAEIRSAGAST